MGTDPHAALIQARGEAHETEQLEELCAGAQRFVDLSALPPATDRAALEAGAAATRDAMRDGADLIYQAPLFDGREARDRRFPSADPRRVRVRRVRV